MTNKGIYKVFILKVLKVFIFIKYKYLGIRYGNKVCIKALRLFCVSYFSIVNMRYLYL